MKTIYKYPLVLDDRQTVMMPRGAHILSIQLQRGEPMLWARVDTEAPNVPRVIACADTGHPAPGGSHIDTIQLSGGALIFHFFDQGES